MQEATAGFFRDCSAAQASKILNKKRTQYHKLYKVLGGRVGGGGGVLGQNDPPK